MKLWDKGLKLDTLVEEYTVGNDPELDLGLLVYDCRASIAHANMLGNIGVLKKQEVQKLTKELKRIEKMAESGKFLIKQHQEDGHTAIEEELTKRLGNLGKKIHTARSRNDQVLTALRLYVKDALAEMNNLSIAYTTALKDLCARQGRTPLPGYTHTRKAMPSSVRLWTGAYIDSMKDNLLLLKTVQKILDQSPLGTAAGYGVPMNIDRALTAKQLGFSRIQKNPIYAQKSRWKFDALVLHWILQFMGDLNTLASDLIFFSLPDLGYVDLPEEFCTGSSIMPQKKNPDVLELIRANYHRILGNAFGMQSMMGNLISGYHRDAQIPKESLMRSLDITSMSLAVITRLVTKLSFNDKRCQQAMTDELFATEEAYKLVEKGVPFREAYQHIAKRYHKATSPCSID